MPTQNAKLGGILSWAAGSIGFVLISSVVGLMLKLNSDMATVQEQVSRVEQVEDLLEREAIVETRIEYLAAEIETIKKVASVPAAYLQLSSAKDQVGTGIRTIEMELLDAHQHIGYDPRRSNTDITIEMRGAYYTAAAPQVAQENNDKRTGCYDMWMNVNGKDVNNSNVRYCFPIAPNATDVLVAQGVACYAVGDVINLRHSGTLPDVGIKAIQPENEPLIPSIIFAMFRVGDC